MLDFIKNMISPKIGLNLIRGQLEKQLKVSVDNFTMVCNFIQENTFIEVPVKPEDNVYTEDGKPATILKAELPNETTDKLNSMVSSLIESELDVNAKIDLAKIHYNGKDNPVTGRIYFQKNGIKEFKDFSI